GSERDALDPVDDGFGFGFGFGFGSGPGRPVKRVWMSKDPRRESGAGLCCVQQDLKYPKGRPPPSVSTQHRRPGMASCWMPGPLFQLVVAAADAGSDAADSPVVAWVRVCLAKVALGTPTASAKAMLIVAAHVVRDVIAAS